MVETEFSREELSLFLSEHPATPSNLIRLSDYLRSLLGWGVKIIQKTKPKHLFELKVGANPVTLRIADLYQTSLGLNYSLNIQMQIEDITHVDIPLNIFAFYLLNAGGILHFLNWFSDTVKKEATIDAADWKVYQEIEDILKSIIGELNKEFMRMFLDADNILLQVFNSRIDKIQEYKLWRFLDAYKSIEKEMTITSQNVFTVFYYRICSQLFDSSKLYKHINQMAYSFLWDNPLSTFDSGTTFNFTPLIIGTGISEKDFLAATKQLSLMKSDPIHYLQSVHAQTHFISAETVLKGRFSVSYRLLFEDYAGDLDTTKSCGVWRTAFMIGFINVRRTSGTKPRAKIIAEIHCLWNHDLYTNTTDRPYPFQFRNEIGTISGDFTEKTRKQINDHLESIHIFMNNYFNVYPLHNFLVANDPFLLYEHLYTHPSFEIAAKNNYPIINKELFVEIRKVLISDDYLNLIPITDSNFLSNVIRAKILKYLDKIKSELGFGRVMIDFDEFLAKYAKTFAYVGINYKLLNEFMPFIRDPNWSSVTIDKTIFGDGSMLASRLWGLLKEGFYLEIGVFIERLMQMLTTSDPDANIPEMRLEVLKTFGNRLTLEDTKHKFHIYYPFTAEKVVRETHLQSRGSGIAFFDYGEVGHYRLVKLNATPFLKSEFRLINQLIKEKGCKSEWHMDIINIEATEVQINIIIFELRRNILDITLSEWNGFLNMFETDAVKEQIIL